MWRTCLREIAFVEHLPDAGTAAEGLEEGDAYALLVEVVAGLRSPIIGETEVQAQFKAFLASLDAGDRGGELRRLGQHVLGDARGIRRRHLQGFGAHSYGQLAVRRLAAGAHLVLVGTGALARQVHEAAGHRTYDQWGRGPDRSAVRPVQMSVDRPAADAAVSIVVAAPVGAADLDRVIAAYPAVRSVIDLRSEHERTAVASNLPVVTLDDLFADARRHGATAAAQIDAARAEVRQLGRAYDRSEQLHPFGWDDLCA